jgi:hypothetical protein
MGANTAARGGHFGASQARQHCHNHAARSIAKKNFNAVSRPVPGTAMGENAGAAARIVPA